MVINKNNLKHTLKNARPLLSFSSPNFFFFFLLLLLLFSGIVRKFAHPNACVPGCCAHQMQSVQFLGPSHVLAQCFYPQLHLLDRHLGDLYFQPFLLRLQRTIFLFLTSCFLSPPPPPFFFNKVTVYIILNFSRIFVILLLQFYY